MLLVFSITSEIFSRLSDKFTLIFPLPNRFASSPPFHVVNLLTPSRYRQYFNATSTTTMTNYNPQAHPFKSPSLIFIFNHNTSISIVYIFIEISPILFFITYFNILILLRVLRPCPLQDNPLGLRILSTVAISSDMPVVPLHKRVSTFVERFISHGHSLT